jgi:hypothetical protein
MHPAWQMLQVVSIEGSYHVDRNMVFGSAASPRLWCDFFSLVLWAAVHKYTIRCLFSFVDDSWGLERTQELVTFQGHRVPLAQARFLSLLTRIGFPWSWDKQEFGKQLEIIGFMVDTRNLTLSMREERRTELVTELRKFSESSHRTLREFQQLTGFASWYLNVLPTGRWALQSSWNKTDGKAWPGARVPVNCQIKADLLWLADCFEVHQHLDLLAAVAWKPHEADAILWCDACPFGFGFWFPRENRGFYGTFDNLPIYLAESMCVAIAVHMAATAGHIKILAYTDSLNSVHLFASHKPTDELRQVMRAWTTSQLLYKTLPRVVHTPGENNQVADALSRGLLDAAKSYSPSIKLTPITPPEILRGGAAS